MLHTHTYAHRHGHALSNTPAQRQMQADNRTTAQHCDSFTVLRCLTKGTDFSRDRGGKKKRTEIKLIFFTSIRNNLDSSHTSFKATYFACIVCRALLLCFNCNDTCSYYCMTYLHINIQICIQKMHMYVHVAAKEVGVLAVEVIVGWSDNT